MDKQKIEQNIERVYAYMFGTLGCSFEEAVEIFIGVIEKRGSINHEQT